MYKRQDLYADAEPPELLRAGALLFGRKSPLLRGRFGQPDVRHATRLSGQGLFSFGSRYYEPSVGQLGLLHLSLIHIYTKPRLRRP